MKNVYDNTGGSRIIQSLNNSSTLLISVSRWMYSPVPLWDRMLNIDRMKSETLAGVGLGQWRVGTRQHLIPCFEIMIALERQNLYTVAD